MKATLKAQTSNLNLRSRLARLCTGCLLFSALTLALVDITAAPFSDADWSSLGGAAGANGEVWATAVDSSGNLYIGGDFTSVGGVPANHVAKWNGSAWSALGSGLGWEQNAAAVYALAVTGNDLYVGGTFTTAGGTSAICIAKWDGSTWSPLAAGVNNTVSALAVAGTNLYVAGKFTMAGGSGANYVAKWDGTAWSALGAGVNNEVLALAAAGSSVFAGGDFTMADGSTVNYVAEWNGNAWLPLGDWPYNPQPGVNGSVYALAVSGGDLYVGGRFSQAAGYYSAMRVARWDGEQWWPLGAGVNNSVFALAVSGGDVFAGGAFITAGGSSANYVAKWDGSTWSALGSGLDYWVSSLAASGSGLYVGGFFTTAGGSSSLYLAKAAIGSTTPPSAPFFTSIAPNQSRTQVLLTYTSDPGASFYLLSSTNLTMWQTNSTVNATNATNSVWINVTRPYEFYRLRKLP